MLVLPFLLTLFEWYEFSAYNSLIPYLSSIIGAESNIYLGTAILASSFVARSIGSLFFARLENPLSASLKLMSISTLLIAVLPTTFLPKWALICWITVCKFMQGFALGGSYGLSYISVYEKSPKDQVCYRVAVVQMGWVIGMILGEVSMMILKGSNGSIYGGVSDFFLKFGWRIPFSLSAIAGSLLLIYSEGLVIEKQEKTFSIQKRDILRYLLIFLAISLEMNLFYMWFVYSPLYSEFASKSIFPAFVSILQKTLMVILFPIAGLLCDMIGSMSIALLSVCGFIVVLSPLSPWNGPVMFFLSSIVGAMCYASLIPWVMSIMSKLERRSILGFMFSLAASVFGGTIPITAIYLQDKLGFRAVGGLMLLYALISATAIIIINRQNTIDNDNNL